MSCTTPSSNKSTMNATHEQQDNDHQVGTTHWTPSTERNMKKKARKKTTPKS
jgi:hypothetical protein